MKDEDKDEGGDGDGDGDGDGEIPSLKRLRHSSPLLVEEAQSIHGDPSLPFESFVQHIGLRDPTLCQAPHVVSCSRYCGPSMDTFWRDSNIPGGKSKLVVVGHRGCGKNKTLTSGSVIDSRPSVMENTIMSFSMAARNGADFVEFDVQVTKDGHPVIFHDDIIVTEDQGQMVSGRIPELTLDEFLSIGPQKNSNKVGRMLARKNGDGSISNWNVTLEDSLCTLKDAFEKVEPTVGFNIEAKFEDTKEVSESELSRAISAILLEVEKHAIGRKICFSSFHPDAVEILRKEQSEYPVFFLTDGGIHLYNDPRRNSIEAAIDICQKCGLQGIVSEVQAVLQNPTSIPLVKEAQLSLLTYGELNNMAEALQKQEKLGIDGVIVDHVLEMVNVARNLDQPPNSPQSHSTNIPLTPTA